MKTSLYLLCLVMSLSCCMEASSMVDAAKGDYQAVKRALDPAQDGASDGMDKVKTLKEKDEWMEMAAVPEGRLERFRRGDDAEGSAPFTASWSMLQTMAVVVAMPAMFLTNIIFT